MRQWNKTLFSLALSGLVLFASATVLLMCAPDYFYEKLALFIGGGLLSLTALILQVRCSRCHQDG